MTVKTLIEYNVRINEALQKICAPLLNNFPLVRFAYGCFFEDKMILLNSHLENLRFTLSYVFTTNSIGQEFQQSAKSTPLNKWYYFLWPEKSKDSILENYRNHGIANGLTIYKRRDNCVEFWCFASRPEQKKVSLFYMNEGKFYLHNFINYFNTKAREIIEQTPFMIFEKNLDISYDDSIQFLQGKKWEFSELRYLVHTENKHAFISPREKECLYYLTQGMTAKETSSFMKISSKTVESYLQEVKEKTNLLSRWQLVELYSKFWR